MRIAILGILLLAAAIPLSADTKCDCDASQPETLKARQCSLCAEAEKQPPGQVVFFLKDANPRKANRLLALPRSHGTGLHRMADLPLATQTALWTAAIDKARELFIGDDVLIHPKAIDRHFVNWTLLRIEIV